MILFSLFPHFSTTLLCWVNSAKPALFGINNNSHVLKRQDRLHLAGWCLGIAGGFPRTSPARCSRILAADPCRPGPRSLSDGWWLKPRWHWSHTDMNLDARAAP